MAAGSRLRGALQRRTHGRFQRGQPGVAAQPQGAFYIYADCSTLTDDSERFALDLLESAGVAVTHGLDFGNNAPKAHLRFAYTNPVERLAEAVERIRRHIG